MKNNLLFIVSCIIISACQQESKSAHITVKTDLSVADTTKKINKDTLKILSYGEKIPALYENAQHIIEKKYPVKFIDVAGCEVSTKLIDSVKKSNNATYAQLSKLYNRNIESEINNSLSEEYSYLNKLDNFLRKTQTQESNLVLIYYVKKQHTYKAYYLFSDQNTLQNKIKLVLEIDSATKKIISKTQKDELQTYNLNTLQND